MAEGAPIYVTNLLITLETHFKINCEGCKDVCVERTLQNNRKLIIGSNIHLNYNILTFEAFLANII